MLCSPSGQAVSPSAVLALKELMELLGEEDDDTEPRSDHCDMCTLSYITFPSLAQVAGQSPLRTQSTVYAAFEVGFVYRPHGPPTGSRAPPYFI